MMTDKPVTRTAIAVGIVLLALLGGATWASVTGFGLAQPGVVAPSAREGSARPNRPGFGRVGYVGGGFRGGK